MTPEITSIFTGILCALIVSLIFHQRHTRAARRRAAIKDHIIKTIADREEQNSFARYYKV